MRAKPSAKTLTANADLERPGVPREIHVKLRLPVQNALRDITVNDNRINLGGRHKDTVIIHTGSEKQFEIVGGWE